MRGNSNHNHNGNKEDAKNTAYPADPFTMRMGFGKENLLAKTFKCSARALDLKAAPLSHEMVSGHLFWTSNEVDH